MIHKSTKKIHREREKKIMSETLLDNWMSTFRCIDTTSIMIEVST